MKRTISTALVTLATIVPLVAQTTYEETTAPSSLPMGITYQAGPGDSNSTYNWTYPYGTKLTVNHSWGRNFEIGTTTYPLGRLVFRQWSPNSNPSAWDDWSTILTENSLGNVGIGTNTPSQKLQIHNPTAFNPNMESQAQDHILFSSNSPGNGGFYGGLTWRSGSRRRASIVASQEHSDGDHIGLAFFTQGVDGPGPMSESMRIRHNGNVGIGTSDPGSYKLAVNGTIRAKEVIVDTGWSDFVFDENYKLRSLDEVENHIEEYGHLPDVPSASSVQSEGLSVGEAQKIMMQKIEELTLYVIAQQKEIEVQRKEIEMLKSN